MSTPNYDVDAPEGATKTQTAYYSKKDVKWVSIILAVLIVVGIPVWYGFRDQRNKQVCAGNMKAAYDAMIQYAEQNDSRLPPLYEVGPGGAPKLFGGRPVVWTTQVSPYMSPRFNFVCPSAENDELMKTTGQDANGKSREIDLTYGMYVPMSASPYMLLSKPDTTALIAETSNNGAQGSFDPLPFKDPQGHIVPFDGFMVGFDDSNSKLTPTSRFVTRLAIRNVSKGYSSKDALTRHGIGIHLFFVDGHSRFLHAADAEINNVFPDVGPPWRTK